MDGYLDPVYDPTLMDKIPDEFKEFSLEKLVHNRMELEQFRQFLAENYSSMDLMCWMDIETFRRIPPNEDKRRDNKAKDLKVKYLNKKYFFGPNSPAGKEGQDKVNGLEQQFMFCIILFFVFLCLRPEALCFWFVCPSVRMSVTD